MRIAFTVYGTPEPQGSSRAFLPKGWRRPVITSDNKDLKPYRQQVSVVAFSEMKRLGLEPAKRKRPVELNLVFYFQRPKSTSEKDLMTVRPDLDKCCRAVMDALSKGICYHDDAQVTTIHLGKVYGAPERTQIMVLWA